MPRILALTQPRPFCSLGLRYSFFKGAQNSTHLTINVGPHQGCGEQAVPGREQMGRIL